MADGLIKEYVWVNGQRVWHEVHGEGGAAVVLLHGGFAGASSWAAQAPSLVAAGFRVYIPERRGHSRTADIEGPFTYEVMATDTIMYLETMLHDEPAHLVGWSDGAVVALLTALARPDLVHRMVLIGQYYNSSGRLPASPLELMIRSPAGMEHLRAGYDPVSPDGPGHFAVVYEKMLEMVGSGPEIELSRLASVHAETLVLQGDRDEVLLGHSVDVVKALGRGRLAVLPGSHALPVESPDVVNSLLAAFLRAGPPAPLW